MVVLHRLMPFLAPPGVSFTPTQPKLKIPEQVVGEPEFVMALFNHISIRLMLALMVAL